MSKRYREMIQDLPGEQYPSDNYASVTRRQNTSTQSGRSSIAMESFDRLDVEKDGISAESFMFDYVEITYDDVQEGIQTEFKELLIKESRVRRSFLHKGLISSVLFFIILVVGIVFVELNFPKEGFKSIVMGSSSNSTVHNCKERLSLCFGLRAVRSIGLFGFFGGISNWLFIILLFWKIPFLIGTGVFETYHKDVIDGLRYIVLEVLFDEEKLKDYVSGTNKNMQKALQLNQHFEALLESSAADKIIEMKTDKFLTSPQGILLTHMGTNEDSIRITIKQHVKSITNKLSKIIHDQLRIRGITDGGLKTEISRILEPRFNLMEPTDINKILTLMIRKHLSWLIIWGNVFGAILGLMNEIILILIVAYVHS